MVRPYIKRTPEQRLALKKANLERLEARYRREEEKVSAITKGMIKLNLRIVPLRKALETNHVQP